MKRLKKVFIIIAIMFLGLIDVFLFVFIFVSISLPDVSQWENLFLGESSEIYDREGNLLYTIYGNENREKVELRDVSPYLVNATIAIEDTNFWYHVGVDPWGIGKAVLYEGFGVGVRRGGSTITQQYAKNAFLTSEKTYVRKLKELVLAVNLEFFHDKETILELYLNKIPYGNNAFGCKKAAKLYFGEDVKFLSVAQSAILAALPQAPSTYNPYGDNRYSHLKKEFTEEELESRVIRSEKDLFSHEFDRGLIGAYVFLDEERKIYIYGRADIVLNRMYGLEMISFAQRYKAFKDFETIEFENYKEQIKYPHFVFYILSGLEKKYGREFLEQGGLKIFTTIDPGLQDFVEDYASKRKSLNKRYYGANNMASLTVNVKTGEILAMLGSVDFYDSEIDGQVNVVTRLRQPGSSFKPFVYAKAFLNGYSPSHVIYDVPTKIGSRSPQNYDGKYVGQMTMREALGKSRNIPAIKSYYLAGEQNEIIDLVSQMGIKSLNKEHDYGYPLALGAGEVSLFEMVQGYSVFANNGKKVELSGILKIEDGNGNVLDELKFESGLQVLEPAVSYLITHIMSDKSVAIGLKTFLSNGHTVAVKTGTSTKKAKSGSGGGVRPGDVWTLGYTPEFATGVWIGNTKGDGLYFKANGYDAAAPVFTSIMNHVLKGKEKEIFPIPEGIEFRWVSKISGQFPGTDTPKNYWIKEVFAVKNFVPTEREAGYFRSGVRVNSKRPEDVADFFNWAIEVKNFYAKSNG